MNLLTTTLCLMASVRFVAGGVRVWRHVFRAPEGYEDEGGFHFVESGAAVEAAPVVDLTRTSTHV